VALCIELRNGEGVRRDIAGDRARTRQNFEQRESNSAAARANVGDEQAFAPRATCGLAGAVHCAMVLQHVLDDGFGGGARNEHALVNVKRHAEKPAFTHEILHGFVPQSTRDQIAQRLLFKRACGAIGIEVEFEAFATQHVRHQEFGEQTRRIKVFLREGLLHPREELSRGPGLLR
jgi:hypothetical protein